MIILSHHGLFLFSNSMFCLFALSYITSVHINLLPNWSDTKQIPPFLFAIWPKPFNMLKGAVKCSNSPEKDRDEWARNGPKREGSETDPEHEGGQSDCAEWCCGTYRASVTPLEGPTQGNQNIHRYFLSGEGNACDYPLNKEVLIKLSKRCSRELSFVSCRKHGS